MSPVSLAPLINLLGFAVGVGLYALLLTMAARHPVREFSFEHRQSAKLIFDWRLLAAAMLGLLWNAGAFAELIRHEFLQQTISSPALTALAHAALGFLPAVVVHSAWASAEETVKTRFLTGAAYVLSLTAAALHFYDAIRFDFAPSILALQILTFGYLFILTALFFLNFQQTIERKAIWGTALAVFAVSALHLSQPHGENNSWLIELVGHQASLLLALAILFQDFRFAFADLFLKRALSVLLLVLTCAGFYLVIAQVFLQNFASVRLNAPQTVAAAAGLMVSGAMARPILDRAAIWFVDKILLRRANYQQLKIEISRIIGAHESSETILRKVSERLGAALTATAAIVVVQTRFDQPETNQALSLVSVKTGSAEISIPTAESPAYQIVLREFAGARRLLSDEIEMLETVAVTVARRIDVLRVTHERCERELREQEFSKLASEAELRALRAQINPHFLFNALTTIGYLIDNAPDKALHTLLRLTQLLRAVLHSNSEFLTIGDELKLIESYLEIERARFEERLTVEIAAEPQLLQARIPSLILQPIVENAVKHGITPHKKGGKIKITIVRDRENMIIKVHDTGAGVDAGELAKQRLARVGLNNVEQRLQLYFDGAAQLLIESQPGAGTMVEIKIRLTKLQPQSLFANVATAAKLKV